MLLLMCRSAFAGCIVFHSTTLVIKVIPTLQQHMFSKHHTAFTEREWHLYENK